MTRLSKVLRLLPVALVIGVLAIAVACGDDDSPTPQPTVSITPEDEQALDKAVADVIAALQLRTTTALDSLANDQLRSRPEQLDRLATCFPEAGGAISVRSREMKPGTGSSVRLTINFTVTQDGATENSRRDWRFERQADGTYKLSDAPDCPFRRAIPSADVGEPTVVPETEPVEEEPIEEPVEEEPIEEVPEETGPPVEP
jgi:hypothetical protein